MPEENNIDELSRLIGGMQAGIDNLAKTSNSIEGKVDHTNDTVIALVASVKSAHKRLDRSEANHKEDMGNILPRMDAQEKKITELNYDKKTIIWLATRVAAAIGIIFGVLGNAAIHLIR